MGSIYPLPIVRVPSRCSCMPMLMLMHATSRGHEEVVLVIVDKHSRQWRFAACSGQQYQQQP